MPHKRPEAAKALPLEAPNTKILPFDEDMPVVDLVFEGKLGRFPLKRGEVLIGRHSEDDIGISDVRVSRHHARLVIRGANEAEIENLTAGRPSPNPMIVNGVAMDHAILRSGDVISLGGVAFRFEPAAEA